jgi:hypothetical protein
VARNFDPGNQVSKFSHAKRKPRLPKIPLGVIASQPLYRSISGKIPTDNTKQTTSPGIQLLPLLLYLISLVLPSSAHPDLLFTNPNDPTCPPAKLPYKKVRIKLSHAPFLPLPRLHPTSLRFCFRALPLLSFHYHCHIPRNHFSFTQASTPTQ